MIQNKKVAVAMSGGVDSGTSAALLIREGYDCAGIHLRLCQLPEAAANLKAARATAEELGMPFEVLDCEKVFKGKVVDYFLAAYAKGLTPNPCVVCNQLIKFGELLGYIKSQGFDFLATGHYARVVKKGELYHLVQAKDLEKDQSYFLYRLGQEELGRVLFPLGEYRKEEVKRLARKWKLPVAKSRESQDICFLGGEKTEDYLKRNLRGKVILGETITRGGEVIGSHQGLAFYTLGQRTGFKITARDYQQSFGGKLPVHYVIGKDLRKNQLIVGVRKEAKKKEFWVSNLSWIGGLASDRLLVKIRSAGRLLKLTDLKIEGVKAKIFLARAEVGVAPGQSAVFYKKFKDSFEVLGGGVID